LKKRILERYNPDVSSEEKEKVWVMMLFFEKKVVRED